MGRRRLTQADWIIRAMHIHDHKYDYSQVQYTGAHDSVTIICPDHGPWTTTATAHINAETGCPKCNNQVYLANFIRKAKRVHGARYDYSKVVWSRDQDKKYTIVCREHGPFQVSPRRHLAGMHCNKCRSPTTSRVLGFGDYTAVTTYVAENTTPGWIINIG